MKENNLVRSWIIWKRFDPQPGPHWAMGAELDFR